MFSKHDESIFFYRLLLTGVPAIINSLSGVILSCISLNCYTKCRESSLNLPNKMLYQRQLKEKSVNLGAICPFKYTNAIVSDTKVFVISPVSNNSFIESVRFRSIRKAL